MDYIRLSIGTMGELVSTRKSNEDTHTQANRPDSLWGQRIRDNEDDQPTAQRD